MLFAGRWTQLKQRIKASLKDAAGAEGVTARLGELDQAVSARLDAVEASLDRRLQTIEQKTAYLEKFSHGARATYLGDNRVLVRAVLNGANIAYFVEADDLLLSPWFIVTGSYETELTGYFLRELRPDSHCIDVGANFGYFTCLMGRFCPNGLVIGIEANEAVFKLCRDSIHVNGLDSRTSILHAAANDSGADLVLHRRVKRSGVTSITKADEAYVQAMGEDATEAFTVRGLRIDDLADRTKGRVDFMKVDVEGAEPLVFEGARRTIADNPQLNIVMEWSPGQIRDAGFDIAAFLGELKGMGLRPFDIQPGAIVPLSFDEVAGLPYRAGLVLTRGA